MDKIGQSINEIKKILYEWQHFPEASDKAHNRDALSELDDDLNHWFNKLENAVDDLATDWANRTEQ